jgi:Protein of unknown function (DUF3592)
VLTSKEGDKLKLLKRIVALGLAGLAVYFVVTGTSWNRYRRLTTEGEEVSGTVTAKEPQNHAAIVYSYVVKQKTYNSIGMAGHGNPTFNDLRIGDSVKVYYDPADPGVSCLGYPSEHFRDSTIGVTLAVVGLALGFLIALARGKL